MNECFEAFKVIESVEDGNSRAHNELLLLMLFDRLTSTGITSYPTIEVLPDLSFGHTYIFGTIAPLSVTVTLLTPYSFKNVFVHLQISRLTK